MVQEGMLTVTEVAAMLHVHPNTIRVWTNRGFMKSYRIGPRGDRRFLKEDVHSFISAEGGRFGLSLPSAASLRHN
jgi:excisionase family DNA binding protein